MIRQLAGHCCPSRPVSVDALAKRPSGSAPRPRIRPPRKKIKDKQQRFFFFDIRESK
jgi:hypothetical protein